MKTEKRISYESGISRSPSDFLAQEGALAESINLVSDHGETKPLLEPLQVMNLSSNDDALFVHQMATTHNIIVANGSDLYFTSKSPDEADWPQQGRRFGSVTGTINGVQSVGNTLIVATTTGLNYFVWKANDYQQLASRIPFPKVEFMLANAHELYVGNSEWLKTENIGDLLEDVINRQTHEILKQDEWNDIVYGLMAENDEDIKKKGCFSRPFFIRYALRLYDGEYMYHSQPILVLPSITDNCYFMFQNDKIKCITHHTQLYYRVSSDYSAWSDIVAGVDVFATEQAHLYDTSVDATCSDRESSIEVWQGYGVTTGAGGVIGSSEYNRKCNETIDGALRIVKSVGDGAIEDELLTLSQFYKIADLGIGSTEDWQTLKIKPHTLENLNTQEYLKNDDFYSRCPLSAAFIKSYNGRLNMADVQRGFFLGFDNFILADNSAPGGWVIDVTISTADGNKVVRKEVYRTKEKMLHWFYYPDARAKKVELYYGHQRYTVNLKEHPGLNGAYFLSLPDEEITTSEAADVPSWTMPSNESIPNQIITSEVNNPFIFKADGYNAIGTGHILGMATQTAALSQGQFGEYPLLVFSTDGIWAMSVGSTGIYQSVHPMSREVCLYGKSITETDKAVYFVSKKGLMVVSGNEVACVTPQMVGKTFAWNTLEGVRAQDFNTSTHPTYDWRVILGACVDTDSFLKYVSSEHIRIAYDYAQSMLMLFNRNYDYGYTFDMATGAVGKVVYDFKVEDVVKNYPDYLLQTTDHQQNNKMFSLYHKTREEDVTGRKRGFLLSRPMKFDGMLTVSSLREMVNVGMWDKSLSAVKTVVWVSDDLYHWYLITSRFGAAAKYFRIGLFTNLLPSERLSGTVVRIQERRDNNLRR